MKTTVTCLHYQKIFFRVVTDGNRFQSKKLCYKCYRRSFLQTVELFSLSFRIMKLRFKRLSGRAHAPTRATLKSACYNLFLTEEIELKPQSVQTVKTDISLKIPNGHYAHIAGRSNWAQKFVDIGGGLIDANYRGNICVVLFNFLNKFYMINEGDGIGQIILEKITLAEVEEVEALDSTKRGTFGFGLTGF